MIYNIDTAQRALNWAPPPSHTVESIFPARSLPILHNYHYHPQALMNVCSGSSHTNMLSLSVSKFNSIRKMNRILFLELFDPALSPFTFHPTNSMRDMNAQRMPNFYNVLLFLMYISAGLYSSQSVSSISVTSQQCFSLFLSLLPNLSHIIS